jgi:hypothetical protein
MLSSTPGETPGGGEQDEFQMFGDDYRKQAD